MIVFCDPVRTVVIDPICEKCSPSLSAHTAHLNAAAQTAAGYASGASIAEGTLAAITATTAPCIIRRAHEPRANRDPPCIL